MDALRLFRPDGVTVDAAGGFECLLRENRPLRLTAACGRCILCTDGCAWITAPGMADLFLRGGETWRIDLDGLILIEAIGSAVVVIG